MNPLIVLFIFLIFGYYIILFLLREKKPIIYSKFRNDINENVLIAIDKLFGGHQEINVELDDDISETLQNFIYEPSTPLFFIFSNFITILIFSKYKSFLLINIVTYT